MTCSIPECDRPVSCRGWCHPHYKRFLRWGDPLGSRVLRDPECTVEGCDRPHEAQGLCGLHYGRVRASGSTSLPTTADRFFAKVEFGDVPQGMRTPCLLWTGASHSAGYGQIRVDGRIVPAHRWLYERWIGPIPDGLEIDHLCVNPPCVNPDHLEPVTRSVNIERTWSRGSR